MAAREDQQEGTHPFAIKWQGKLLEVSVPLGWTVLELRQYLGLLTSVELKHLKVMGLKGPGNKPAVDATVLEGLHGLKRPQPCIMMGTPSAEIDAGPPPDLPPLEDDLTAERDEELLCETLPENLAKVEQRIKTYKCTVLHPPRPGKRALVLDIDYTFFDCGSPAESAKDLARPYLHEMLTRAYTDYDIIIWSATSMKWIETKLNDLGMFTHPDYRITMMMGMFFLFTIVSFSFPILYSYSLFSLLFFLDYQAMITVSLPGLGVSKVKPLGVMWGLYPNQYSPANTIMIDDLSRNFVMNPQTGLRIRPYRISRKDTDHELYHISSYLSLIAAAAPDFSLLNHRKWSSYLSRHQQSEH